MNKLMTLGVGAIALLLVACKQGKTSTTSLEVEQELIGKQLLFDYGSMTVKASYQNDNKLHWEVDSTMGDETISYRRLSPSSFFVNWIEQDGTTVSQVIDLSKHEVSAYITVPSTDSTARGGRSATMLQGKVSVLQ